MIYVILGQSASGKTSLAISLAKRLSIPIISADAYQCYKKMNIATDKPDKEEVEGIDYQFYDCYDPSFYLSVFEFQKEGRKLLDKYLNEGKDVIVTGGTSFYIKALLYNYIFKDNVIEDDYESRDLLTLQEMLKNRSLEVFSSIDSNNPRRVINALRQLDNSEDRFSILKENDQKPIYPCRFFCIDIKKEEGNSLIDQRVEKMFEKGIVQEVRLLKEQYDFSLPAFKAIGYPEIDSYLKNEITLEEAKQLIKVHTHQLAKKQRTFIRHQFADVIFEKKEKITSLIENDHLLKERTKIILKGDISKLEKISVLVAGLGGVGSIVASSLIRAGVKDIFILDRDIVDITNLNRQIMYSLDDLGVSKAQCCKNHLLKISPLAHINTSEISFSSYKDVERKFTYIIDCIDDVNGKAELYLKSVNDRSKLFVSLGAGFHIDSTKVRIGKLKDCHSSFIKRYREELNNKGVEDRMIDEIDSVYFTDSRIKADRNEKRIGSFVSAVNSAGLALVTALIKDLIKGDTK